LQFNNELPSTSIFQPHLTITSGTNEIGNYKIADQYTMPFTGYKHFVRTYDGVTVKCFVDGSEKSVVVSSIASYPASGVTIGK
jgi:hypothetical protein